MFYFYHYTVQLTLGHIQSFISSFSFKSHKRLANQETRDMFHVYACLRHQLIACSRRVWCVSCAGCQSSAQYSPHWVRSLPPWAMWPAGTPPCLQDEPESPDALFQRRQRGAAAPLDGGPITSWQGGGLTGPRAYLGSPGGRGGGASPCGRKHMICL